MRNATAALVAALLCAALVAGCAPKPAATSGPTDVATSSADSRELVPEIAPKPIAGLEDMSTEQKLGELSSSFPVEYPVVKGSVDATESTEGNDLRYQLSVSGSPAATELWYRTTMEQRAFVLEGEEKKKEDGTLTLWYSRAGRKYAVRIQPVNADKTTVVGVITYDLNQH